MAENRVARHLGGVRMRTAMSATLVVALALGAAAVVFVLLLRHQLEASLTNVARQQAADVAAEVTADGKAPDLIGGASDQSLTQVVDAKGRVLGASPSVEGEPPVIDLRPRPGKVVVVSSDRLPIGEGEGFVVVARGTSTPDGPMVVLVAQSLESVRQSTAVAGELLLIGYPLMLLVVALTSYWFTRRALAPVEAIRRRVATIEGATELSARVPVPGGSDEVTRLAMTMNSMLGRLQAGADAQRRFVGDASHELKSPLSTIRAAHEIGTLHPDAADWATSTEEILAELDRLDRLVSDMLLLARYDEHALRLQDEEVDLEDLMSAEAERLRRAGVSNVLVAAPPVRVMGDRHQLARVLRNLGDNAARHAQDQVELRLSADAERATIQVLDDGLGIPATDRERIFERFVRLDLSRTRDSGGTGLGLPIARQIARAHGGDLVAADGGRGARFVLTLPRVAS